MKKKRLHLMALFLWLAVVLFCSISCSNGNTDHKDVESGGNNADLDDNGDIGNNSNTSTDTEEDYYIVYFESNGGSYVESQRIKYGKTAMEPEPPTKENYSFLGWYYDYTAFDFSKPVTSDITLMAMWTPINGTETTYYTVTFDSNGGSEISTQHVESGATAEEPTIPIRNGYEFVAWYYNGNKFDFNTPIIDNITLLAHWSILMADTLISVTIPQYTDIELTYSQDGNTLTFIADMGYTDYIWWVDNWQVNNAMENISSNTLMLDVTGWQKGIYEVTIEAMKDGRWYSATMHIKIGDVK